MSTAAERAAQRNDIKKAMDNSLGDLAPPSPAFLQILLISAVVNLAETVEGVGAETAAAVDNLAPTTRPR